MIALLCIIGIVTLFWLLGKFMVWLGGVIKEMDRAQSEARYKKLVSQAAAQVPVPRPPQIDMQVTITDTRDKIQSLRGEITNEKEYLDRVRREIDELTGTVR